MKQQRSGGHDPRRLALASTVAAGLMGAAHLAAAQTGTWRTVATEDTAFTVSGSVTVRFGVDNRWRWRVAGGTAQCTPSYFGGNPAVGVRKTCAVFEPTTVTPGTWSNLASEGASFSLTGTRTVRYGAGSTWIERSLSGTVQCTNTFFGADPLVGAAKSCQVLAVTTPPPPTPPVTWAPNDPLLPVGPVWGPVTAPPTYQWGLHAMKFPEAWAKVRGQAYIGMIEGRRPAPHADLDRNYRGQFDNCATVDACTNTTALGDNLTAHSMHVAGIIAAHTNNAKGVAGACPECSTATFSFALNETNADRVAANAILAALNSGMQIINWSGNIDLHGRWGQFNDCNTAPLTCAAMQTARNRDVLLVQAAGNYNEARPPFPSFHYNDYWVLPVGGTARAAPRVGDPGARWTFDGTFGSAFTGVQGVIAPAKSILSTFRPGDFVVSNEPDANCGDTAGVAASFSHLVGVDQSGKPNDGYGTCTGTSMAAPHVSALAGLVRSVNPLLSADQVRQIIRNSGNQATAATKTAELGWGLPDAGKAVTAALATNPTRLTPLFAFYSADRVDSFYTTVPQMARAALGGTLAPRRSPGESLAYNSAYGTTVGSYGQFPDPIPPQPAFGGLPTVDRRPLAEVYVFTTPTNPKSSSTPLAPLYRLSWKCGDPTPGGQPAICATHPGHIDVTYTADPAGVTAFEGLGYRLDGIEGYIYPRTLPQPAGTVRLMRKYNPTRDDHAIFPESKLPAMQAAGYVQDTGSDWLGYAYPNTGTPLTAIP